MFQFRAAAVYAFTGIMQRGASFILLLGIIQFVPVDAYARIGSVVAVSAVMGSVISGPIEVAVFRGRFLGDDEGKSAVFYGGTYVFFLLPLCAIAIASAGWLVQDSPLGVPGYVWLIGLLGAALHASGTSFSMVLLRAQESLIRYLWLALLSVSAQVMAKFTLVVFMDDAVLAWVLGEVISGALVWVLGLSPLVSERWLGWLARPQTGAGTFWRNSWPQLPHRLCFWVVGSVTRPVALAAYAGSAAGSFALSVNLAAVAGLLVAEINRGFAVHYVRTGVGGMPAQRVDARLAVIGSIVVIVSGGLVWVFGSFLVPQEYAAAYGLLGILLWGQLGYALYLVPMNNVSFRFNRAEQSWRGSVVGVGVLCVGLILVLWSGLGVEWLAVVQSLSYWGMYTGSLCLAKRCGAKPPYVGGLSSGFWAILFLSLLVVSILLNS